MKIHCFKAYDVRGVVPDQLNPEIARRIGRAFVEIMDARRVVLGHDIRLTSPALADAVAEGLIASGADVLDIGLCGTEEVYFATPYYEADGGIMVTASHNPMDYNGLKFVGPGSRPVSGDSELPEIRQKAEDADFSSTSRLGQRKVKHPREAYIQHLLGYVDIDSLKPLKIAMDPGNGGASLVIDTLKTYLPFDIVPVNFEPDGNFPNGIPNPLLPEQRRACANAVKGASADLGVAWDGDFDRCFLFDEYGDFIEGYYIVGLLAKAFLSKHPGEKIIHDPRLTWNTVDIVQSSGGTPIQSKTGHAFIKESMRRENAIYGGEMSAHHYFRDFFYCDSGMIPWLLVAELLCKANAPLSRLVAERQAAYPCSGEINFRVTDPENTLARISSEYSPSAQKAESVDGLSYEFDNWRFNLRASNTEPVMRLNVESRADIPLMTEKTREISASLNEG